MVCAGRRVWKTASSFTGSLVASVCDSTRKHWPRCRKSARSKRQHAKRDSSFLLERRSIFRLPLFSLRIMRTTRSRHFCSICFGEPVRSTMPPSNGNPGSRLDHKPFSFAAPYSKSGRAKFTGLPPLFDSSIREDSTNVSRQMVRNRVRHDLIPEIEKRLGRPIKRALLRTIELAADESEFLRSLVPEMQNQPELDARGVAETFPGNSTPDNSWLAATSEYQRLRFRRNRGGPIPSRPCANCQNQSSAAAYSAGGEPVACFFNFLFVDYHLEVVERGEVTGGSGQRHDKGNTCTIF